MSAANPNDLTPAEVAHSNFDDVFHRTITLLKAARRLSFAHDDLSDDEIRKEADYYAGELHGNSMSAGALIHMAETALNDELWSAYRAVRKALGQVASQETEGAQ